MVEVQGFSLFYLEGQGPMSCQLFFTQMHPIRFFGVMERMVVTSQHLNMNLGMFSLVLYANLQGVRSHVGIVLIGVFLWFVTPSWTVWWKK